MSFWKLIAIFAGFTCMWLLLEMAAHRLSSRRDDRARVQALLDREQAAHDDFKRAVRRTGGRLG